MNPPPENQKNLYSLDRQLLDPIDNAFSKVKKESGQALPCGRGCSSCCTAFFEITTLDVWRLHQGLGAIHTIEARDLYERACGVLHMLERTFPSWSAPYDVRDLPEKELEAFVARTHLRCPALGHEQECRLYEHRPRICHLQGLSFIEHESGELLPDFCPDEFGDPDYSAIPPQPLDLIEQWELERRLRNAVIDGGHIDRESGFRTFVATSIVLWYIKRQNEEAGIVRHSYEV